LIRYGPVTVNPRKQPSKTLFTGRRSKYEVLSTDEEEKRRDRRERNRVAATKCREKRENVLSNLDNQHTNELNTNKQLIKLVNDLEQRKLDLETIMNNHLNECLLMNNSSAMIFGDAGFLSSITDAPPPPLPSYPQQNFNSEEEELSLFLDPGTPLLTNSAYHTDEPNSIFPSQPMTSSSIDRLMNALQSPTISMENINNHSILINTAVGSSCAKQHSNSSEDDSLPSKCKNSCVY
jgi:hypothetical protein